MKKILIILLLPVLFTACSDYFLDLDPLDEITEASFFKDPSHFKMATADFYNKMIGLRHFDGYYADFGTDLVGRGQSYGNGTITAGNSDDWWDDSYENLRDVNIFLEKAEEYEGELADIAEYVAVAKFFRAYHHFLLLQRFGGVPIATEAPELDSELLTAPRNSRYEVFKQVYDDLKAAIPDLKEEQDIASSDKGMISKWAAEAFLADALLYEGSWDKYVMTTTDGDGTTEGAGSAIPSGYPSITEMITEANTLAKDVMDNGGYELWDHNDIPEMKNWSNLYLFNLEDAGSNPGGLDKSSNNEFILYVKYDYDLYQGDRNISHTVAGRLCGSRYFIDMFLCTDGLPPEKSPLFMGYTHNSTEWQNRDYRMLSYFNKFETWDIPPDSSISLVNTPLGGETGYSCRKFRSYNYGSYRGDKQESFDYPHIRLPEVYLIYAETLYELNGAITDAQLDETINLIRARAGVAPLSNAFAAANGLDMYEEIMRERSVELFAEGSRYNDLKRLAIAEEKLNTDRLGQVIEGTDYENNLDLYIPENWQYGEIQAMTAAGLRNVLRISRAEDKSYTRSQYLFPIPLEQINLNPNLLQNPSY